MAKKEIKKINVRSPYFITVSKEGAADTDATDTQTREIAISCGDTRNVGATSGTQVYTLDVSDRVAGDITISLSNVRVPIRYQFGQPDSLPSKATIGLDIYSFAWEDATGSSTGLSSTLANPNGVSVDVIYTLTQGDIDAGNTTLHFVVDQPLITTDYSFDVACTNIANDDAADTAGFVTIISFTNEGDNPRGTFTLNGTALTDPIRNATGVTYETTRYVMSDISPNIEPAGGTDVNSTNNRLFFNPNQATPDNGIFKAVVANTYSNTVNYLAENILGSGVNRLVFTPDALGTYSQPYSNLKWTVKITRHPVELVGGVNVIHSNGDGYEIPAIVTSINYGPSTRRPGETVEQTYARHRQKLTIEFNGSNSVELNLISAFTEDTQTREVFLYPAIERTYTPI